MKRVQVCGDECQSVRLFGNPANPEPNEFRVDFPGGYIYVARCAPERRGARPDWWAHIGIHHADHPEEHRIGNLDNSGEPMTTGRIVDARVDCFDKHACETLRLAEILKTPNVDHLAIKLSETDGVS